MRHPAQLLPLAVLIVTGACASLGQLSPAQLSAAENDDHYCAAAHGTFPAQGYTDCRLKLENMRRLHAWQQASRDRWAQQQTLDPSQRNAGLNTQPVPDYLPIRRADFSCHKIDQDGKAYIICGIGGDGR